MVDENEIIDRTDRWGNQIRIEKRHDGGEIREGRTNNGLYFIQIIKPDGRIINKRQERNGVISQETVLPSGAIQLKYNIAMFHNCMTSKGEPYIQLHVQFPEDADYWRSVGPQILHSKSYSRGIFPVTVLLDSKRIYTGMIIGQ